MLKIRLMRIGTNKRPFYRVVAVDERAKRTGAYVELLGTYNPLTEPKEIVLKQDRIDYWVKQGAQMSEGFLRIIGKAPQRPPRKPKKQKQESESHPPEAESQKESKVEEPKAEEAEPKKETEEKKEETVIEETEKPKEESADAKAMADEEK